MKKYFLTICLAVLSLAAFAQIPSIGIKGGVNFATTVSNSGGGNVTSGSLTTFNAGVFVDLRFGNISLQPSLNYFGEGGSFVLDEAVPGVPNGGEGSTSTAYSREHLYYLQLPVDLVYHIPVIIGNIYFGAGPYIAEGISGKTTFSNSSSSDKVTFGSSTDDNVKPTQIGVDALIGFKLRGGLIINANYDLGLSNDLPGSPGDSNKSRVFSISLGYAFL